MRGAIWWFITARRMWAQARVTSLTAALEAAASEASTCVGAGVQRAGARVSDAAARQIPRGV